MLRASMRAFTVKRKWNKKQFGKNPHTTLNKRILSVLVSVFSLTLSLQSLLPSVSREMSSACSSCASRGGRGALSLSLLLMMMVMVMMMMQNRGSPILNVVFEDGGESAADVKQQSSTRKRKRAVDDVNILPMPESNDPLASKRGEGAVKLKNDNNDIRNTSEKHWMEEIFRARDRGIGWTESV